MVARPTLDAPAELQRAFELLTKNWILAVPTAVAALVSSIFIAVTVLTALAGITGAGMMVGSGDVSHAMAGLTAGLLSAPFLIGMPLVLLFSALAYVVTVVAAEDVWLGRSVDFGRAWGVTVSKLPALIVGFIMIILLSIVPSLLIVAFGLGFLLLIVLGFFLMYMLPAIAIGNETGTSAIGASFRIAKANAGPTVIALVALIIVSVIASVINAIVGHVPVLNWLVAGVLGGLTAAYAALVITRFYMLLSGRSGDEWQVPPAIPPSTTITPA